MTRYNKLQRRIRAEQESFLEDVVLAAGFKLCTDMSRQPEGRGVYIEWAQKGIYNFVLIPTFNVPTYMSVKKDSPTFRERAAQEKNAVRNTMFEKLMAEGVGAIDVEDPCTFDVKIRVSV